MYETGEKPGMGIYKCFDCDQTVALDTYDDILPPCPKCHHTRFIKIGI
jgi:DNA-directed RNA polymerase subunit RPC12/RpoP